MVIIIITTTATEAATRTVAAAAAGVATHPAGDAAITGVGAAVAEEAEREAVVGMADTSLWTI